MEEYLRVFAKIDLDVIYNNLVNVRAKLKSDTKLMAVIKANAYGHGANMVARHVEDIVDQFAVAIIDEARELRRSGIKKPILILGYTDESQYKELVELDVAATIYSYEQAKRLSDVAVSIGKKAKVHIKIDTGMRRIGFLVNDDSVSDIEKIDKLPNLVMDGIFTHLSKADMAGDDNISFTKAQFDGLMYMIDELSKRGVTFNIRHCANSAGIMDFPEYQLDMVRSGIITYGLYPSDELDASHIDINPAMELKSHVIHIKEINKGDSIGYGGTYVADDVRKIATIPVGYGDGYLRSLSNKGIVLIRGKRAPIVGRVCMDQFMVDVTDIPDIEIKDEVTLFGRDGDEFLPVDEVANLAGSFNYEFCCDVGLRIPRIYHVNGREDVVISYIDEL